MSSSKPKSDGAAPEQLKRLKCSLSTTMEWTIPNVMSWIDSFIQKSEGTFRKKSPPFSLRCGQAEVQFKLFLVIEEDEDQLGLYLINLNQTDVDVMYDLKAIDKRGIDFGPCETLQRKLTQALPCYGFEDFLSVKGLKEEADDLLPNGSLKLVCELTISDAEVSIEGYEGPSLRECLSNLQNEEGATDFNVVCNGQHFPCHKTILAARSEVFKRMFAHDNVLESKINEVEIKDFKPDTVENFLHFLYSDELYDPALYTIDLLMLADKYNVEGLRKEVEKALVEVLDISNAIKFLSTASMIEAPLLIARTANFIFKNLDKLEGTPDWETLAKSNPQAFLLIFKHRYA